jgi:hypothetical protein
VPRSGGTYAIECDDTAFSTPFKRLPLRAIAIARRRKTLKDATLKPYVADVDHCLNRIIAAVLPRDPGHKLRKLIAANGPCWPRGFRNTRPYSGISMRDGITAHGRIMYCSWMCAKAPAGTQARPRA